MTAESEIAEKLRGIIAFQVQEAETKQSALEFHESLCERERARIASIAEEIQLLKDERNRLKEKIKPPKELLTGLETSRAAEFAARVFLSVLSGHKTIFQPCIGIDTHQTLHCILAGQIDLHSRAVESILKIMCGPEVLESVARKTKRIRRARLSFYMDKEETAAKIKMEKDGEEICVSVDCFFGISWEIDNAPRFGDFYLFN